MTVQDRLLRYAALKTENAALEVIANATGTEMPAILANKQEMAGICRAISYLEDPMERSVIVLRYVQLHNGRPTPWKIVSKQIYGNSGEGAMTAVYRLHRRALRSLKKYFVEK